MCINENNNIDEKEMERKRRSIDAIIYVRSTKIDIICLIKK
jgi:hypothetical protein